MFIPRNVCISLCFTGFENFWSTPIYHPLMGGFKYPQIILDTNGTIANHCNGQFNRFCLFKATGRWPETVQSRSHDPTFSATWSLANTASPVSKDVEWNHNTSAGPCRSCRPYIDLVKACGINGVHNLGVFVVFLCLKNCCILPPVAGAFIFQGHHFDRCCPPWCSARSWGSSWWRPPAAKDHRNGGMVQSSGCRNIMKYWNMFP